MALSNSTRFHVIYPSKRYELLGKWEQKHKPTGIYEVYRFVVGDLRDNSIHTQFYEQNQPEETPFEDSYQER